MATNMNNGTSPMSGLVNKTPKWLDNLISRGYLPYIATCSRLMGAHNLRPFGKMLRPYLLEEEADKPFLNAYLLSNSLGFKSPDLKMPYWVFIDCVLMQTAVIGFMCAKRDLPESFLEPYRNDASIDFDNLDFVPISGHIASVCNDGKSLSGFSLFSLASSIGQMTNVGIYTKALALEAYRAPTFEHLYGITQYDNPAVRVHGRFSTEMEIAQPIVPLHPGKDMTFIYKMSVNYDPMRLDVKAADIKPTFWLQADDLESKKKMETGIREGKRYVIAPPFSIARNNHIFLPILENI